MPIVKMDEKGGIQLPHEVREEWELKAKQSLTIQVARDRISLRKSTQAEPIKDPLLRDILVRLIHSPAKATRRLLPKLADERWSSSPRITTHSSPWTVPDTLEAGRG